MSVKSLFMSVLLAAPMVAVAQRAANDTVMKGTTIEVIQSYKPKVRQAPKPEWIPQLPPADTTHPALAYDVPQQTLYYSYSSLPLRPLALGRDTATLPFKNYVKVGGGNLSTIFVDAGIGGITGKTFESAIHLHHLSQKGDLKFQQSSLSGLDADLLTHGAKSEWHFGVTGERDQYYNYGYENTQTADSLRQTYNLVRLSVDMKNREGKDTKLTYHPAVNASYYGASFNTSETTVGFDVPVTYKFDPLIDAVVAVKGAITNYKTDTASIGNNIIAIEPGININGEDFKGHALVGFAVGKSGGVYVLPNIVATYSAGSNFDISAGWQSTLRQNTYEQLNTENPYMYNTYVPLQTRKDELFLHLQGGAGDHFSWSGKVSYLSFDQLPVYLNDIGNQKQFYVLYDRVNAISVQLGCRYQVGNKWSAGLNTAFYGFSGGSEDKVWHEPSTRIKADFIYLPHPKFTVTAYLAVLGGIYARDLAGNTVKLKTIADMGASAEYLIIPRLSVFAQLNNLFDNHYERWCGYQSYGFNIYGGLRLKF